MVDRRRACLFFCALLCACHAYEPQPLDTNVVLDRVAARRAPALSELDTPLDFARAHALLREGSPALGRAIARFRTLAARASIDEPLPDPGIEFGPQFAFGDDVTGAATTGFASLSLRIPLGPRLAAATNLDRARAEVARIDAQLTLREEQLALRAEWIALLASRRTTALARTAQGLAQHTFDLGQRLVEVGTFTANDLATLALQTALRGSDVYSALDAEAVAEAKLAARTGVDAALFGDSDGELPATPQHVPDPQRVRDLIAVHRGELVRGRGNYAIAERQLRLECAKQWPDLELGPSFSDEPGEDKNTFALGIGLRLPLFDGNQKAIREAEAARDEARTRFELAASEALGEAARATRAITLARARRHAIEVELLPTATRAVELARLAAEAGTGEALSLAESQRALALASRSAFDARVAELDAWLSLERAIGLPLLALSSDSIAVDAADAAPADSVTDLEQRIDDATHDEVMGKRATRTKGDK